MTRITIRTPGRLHFGLFGWGALQLYLFGENPDCGNSTRDSVIAWAGGAA